MVHEVADAGGSAGDPEKLKRAKIARGCGGCGCVLAVLWGLAGAVLVGFGLQPRTDEALPFGVALLVACVPVGIVASGLVFYGMSQLKKLN